MSIELGDKVKDTITGFQGIAVQKAIHMNGCIRWCIQPPVDKEGKFPDACWVDEHSIEVLEPQKIKVEQTKRGGPSKAVKIYDDPDGRSSSGPV